MRLMASDPVPVTIAPNVPIAELLCEKLKDAGIPAYYRDAAFVGRVWRGAAVNPGAACEILVRPEDLERAAQVVSPDAT